MKDAFTVVSDIYPTVTTELASVILPSALWVEKEGVMGQTDRRSQFIPKLVDPPRDARSDFWQIQEIARRIAKGLGRKTKYRVMDPMTGKIKETKDPGISEALCLLTRKGVKNSKLNQSLWKKYYIGDSWNRNCYTTVANITLPVESFHQSIASS